MSAIRLRRHTDGRVALSTSESWWIDGYRNFDSDVSGDGWSELFVAELPEPDGEVGAVDDHGEDVKTPLWRLSFGESVTAWIEGVETPVWELQEDLDKVRSDALKMLAAVTACEKHRGNRS